MICFRLLLHLERTEERRSRYLYPDPILMSTSSPLRVMPC
jgi:hypothetical protein